jgi:hypothetical protein
LHEKDDAHSEEELNDRHEGGDRHCVFVRWGKKKGREGVRKEGIRIVCVVPCEEPEGK